MIRSIVVVAAAGALVLGGTATMTAQEPSASAAIGAIPVEVLESRAIDIPDTRLISMSPDGALIVGGRPAVGYQSELCTFSVETLEQVACADLAPLESGLRIEDVTWSPDSSRLALTERTFQLFVDGDLWLMDANTGVLTDIDDDGFSGRLPILRGTAAPGTISLPVNPAFTPDGLSVTFSRSLIVDGKQAGDAIVTVPITGGPPIHLVDLSPTEIGIAYFGMRWSPDGTRLYYSVHHPSATDSRDGIWVVGADGSDPHLLLGGTDPNAGAPSVVQVSPTGGQLLAFYPRLAGMYTGRGPLYAVVDTATGDAEPLTVFDPGVPAIAYVTSATFSPDGRALLTTARLTNPDSQVFVRELGGSSEVALTPDGLPSLGPVAWGLVPTWTAQGTVFLTGAGSLSHGTLLRLAGSLVTPLPD